MKAFYDHIQAEEKWQQHWQERGYFQQSDQVPSDKEKEYLLFAFAYPSGSGLHVGHVESKTALDILARYKRMNGKHVFFPVGWDAFGLPAENYAVKTGTPPAKTTRDAINTFRRQIKRLGISYDWANEIATNHPGYYHWTQWLFLQLYKQNLAYRGVGMVNWCPQDQTVLANEQVVNGKCERCGTQVVQKELEQWYFKITQYAEELIAGLDQVDWPKATKEQQLHWIGKKEGIDIEYPVVGTQTTVHCFSTRPETNFGATFIVLAPEHPFVSQILAGQLSLTTAQEQQRLELAHYVQKTSQKTELERQAEGRRKTGVFTGFYGLNRLNGRQLPIWISDFVLAGFGTGAVVGVPGHDRRDFQFAQTFQLPVERVVAGPDGQTGQITREDQVFEDDGQLINSEFLNGLLTQPAITKMMDVLEEKGWGKRQTSYKLRDWLISRQRYWGAPIPIVYDPDGVAHPVKEEHLPWLLPTDVDFKPTGESPLKSSQEFFARTERLYGKGWTPECDTMDTFVDSSWYYLRYTDARNPDRFADPQKMASLLPVDLYLIGPEHIVLHLLYSRFFTKFLRDQGYLQFDEPFLKMRHQGMILGPDGKKMSKSKGNVITPDEIIAKYGADTLRVYEMFMGPLESDKPWDTGSVIGVYRFLQRIYHLCQPGVGITAAQAPELRAALQGTIKKVTNDIPELKFNTAIAALMIFVNQWEESVKKAKTGLTTENTKTFIKILAPFAPFLAEEIYHSLTPSAKDLKESVHTESWPKYQPELLHRSQVTIIVQINGKLRGQLEIPSTEVDNQDLIVQSALAQPAIAKWLHQQHVVKTIYVAGKVLNLVVGQRP